MYVRWCCNGIQCSFIHSFTRTIRGILLLLLVGNTWLFWTILQVEGEERISNVFVCLSASFMRRSQVVYIGNGKLRPPGVHWMGRIDADNGPNMLGSGQTWTFYLGSFNRWTGLGFRCTEPKPSLPKYKIHESHRERTSTPSMSQKRCTSE